MCCVRAHLWLPAVTALAFATSCSSQAKEAPAEVAAPGAAPAASDDASLSPCDAFLRRVGALSGFDGTGPADLGYCESLTAEQVACGTAARTTDDLSFCIQFPDPARRAIGVELARSVRTDWPGTRAIVEVTVQRTMGCAFAGLIGNPDSPLTDTAVLAAFAIRDVNAGDPADVLAWLGRATGHDAWRCTRTEPPLLCPRLINDCSAAAARAAKPQ